MLIDWTCVIFPNGGGFPQVWEASGHVAGFSDPMVDCKESKLRYRADQLFYGKVNRRLG